MVIFEGRLSMAVYTLLMLLMVTVLVIVEFLMSQNGVLLTQRKPKFNERTLPTIDPEQDIHTKKGIAMTLCFQNLSN